MINRVELLGNLTHDPELRYTGQGFPYCFIRLATNRYSGGQQHTDFHFVMAWHAHAERASRELHVGDRVFVEARIETKGVVRGDGIREQRMQLVATRLLYLHGRRRADSPSEGSGPASVAAVIAHVAESSNVSRGPAEEGA